jgi:hypothetical protein
MLNASPATNMLVQNCYIDNRYRSLPPTMKTRHSRMRWLGCRAATRPAAASLGSCARGCPALHRRACSTLAQGQAQPAGRPRRCVWSAFVSYHHLGKGKWEPGTGAVVVGHSFRHWAAPFAHFCSAVICLNHTACGAAWVFQHLSYKLLFLRTAHV